MTTDPLSQDKLDREVRKLALRAHLEARQHDDLKSDLAQHVRPSEGPFNPGERIFVWEKDHSKVADTGKWTRGKVLAQAGAMVTAETLQGVTR